MDLKILIIILNFFIVCAKANSEPDNSDTLQQQQSQDQNIYNDESSYYPNGNIRFEIVGDTSHLFEPEDFQKIEVQPLRDEQKSINPEKSGLENDVDHLLFDDVVSKITDSTTLSNTSEIIIDSSNIKISQQNQTKTTVNNKNKSSIECKFKNLTNETFNYENKVKLVNGSVLTTALADSKPNDCFVVMFYVPWCPFSANLAPSFNALPRAFNFLDIFAFDVSKSTGYNIKFGANAVPMVLIFQQKNVIARFNHTQKQLPDLIEFVSKNTGIAGNSSVSLISDDFDGPVPTVAIKRFDYALLFSWIFLAFVLLRILFKKFNFYEHLKRLYWKLFKVQHEHTD